MSASKLFFPPEEQVNHGAGMMKTMISKQTVAGMLWASLLWCLCATAAAAQDGTLRVATVERQPFSIRTEDGWTGFSIELWQELSAALGRETKFVAYESFAGMLDAVRSGDVDAAVANISVTHAREQVMDFSQPIYDSGLLILRPLDASPSILSVILNRELLIWLGGAALLLVVFGNLIWLVERRHQAFGDKGYSRGFSEGLWWSINVVTNASFTIFTPQTWAGRMLAYGLIVIGLFIVSAFVAQITAQLTVGELRSQVEDYNDLRDKRVGTTAGSTSSRFLTAQSIAHVGFDSLADMFNALEAGELDALVHDAPILAYYVQTDGVGKFTTVGRVFQPEKYGIAVPQGAALREDIDRVLLKLREDGSYDQIRNRWFGN